MGEPTKTSETTKTPSVIASLVNAIAPESKTAQRIAEGIGDVLATSAITGAVMAAAQTAANFVGVGVNSAAPADMSQLGVMPPPKGIPGPTPEILAARAQQSARGKP
ncbi:MAG: hypothetical protein KGJ21_09195 [Pseudomonadota bacterium]|nr:hypothetical protein [Pseudomonadota bacterium]